MKNISGLQHFNISYFTGTYSTPSPVSTKHIGPILETALQRAPILYIQTGNIQAAVNRYRYAFIM